MTRITNPRQRWSRSTIPCWHGFVIALPDLLAVHHLVFGGLTINQLSNGVIDQKIDYIHTNPVKEGLVFKAEDYVYSRAIDYSGENGMLDIIVLK